MSILGEKGLSGALKRFLDLVFFGGTLIFCTLPIFLKAAFKHISSMYHENYYFLLVFMYFSGFFALSIVYEVKRILKNINKNNPFSMENVKSLKRISYASFIISVAYIVKIIFYNSFLTMILAMVFIIAGLFSIVLAEVFHQAAIVKQENDLTI